MADYFVATGGSDTAPYETWAKAARSLATALAAATATGDRVIIQYDGVPAGDAENAVDVTYSFAAAISLICSTNSGSATVTPTAMGTGSWIGHSTLNRTVVFAGAFKAHIYGLTVRTAGSISDLMQLCGTDGLHYEWESCYFWHGNTSSSSSINIGRDTNTAAQNSYSRFMDCTFRLGNTAQKVQVGVGAVELEGCVLSSAGSTPTTLFTCDNNPANFNAIGCNFGIVTGTLVSGTATTGEFQFRFDRCKLGAGVVVLGTPNPTNKGSVKVWLSDCASGDTHSAFEYHDAFGSLIVSSGIYQNAAALYDGTNAYSWKIITTANCSTYTPFVSPWIDAYNSDISTAITPYFECLRDGSATAYKDDEVWGEWAYKGTTGFPTATLVNDRVAVAGTGANQASSSLGASDWTGENATAWFGKLAPASSFTPAEIGDISARVMVGLASATVYVTPKIVGLA